MSKWAKTQSQRSLNIFILIFRRKNMIPSDRFSDSPISETKPEPKPGFLVFHRFSYRQPSFVWKKGPGLGTVTGEVLDNKRKAIENSVSQLSVLCIFFSNGPTFFLFFSERGGLEKWPKKVFSWLYKLSDTHSMNAMVEVEGKRARALEPVTTSSLF